MGSEPGLSAVLGARESCPVTGLLFVASFVIRCIRVTSGPVSQRSNDDTVQNQHLKHMRVT